MKHLLTLIVCALLTVSLIVLAEAATIEDTAFNAVTLVALMSLPIVLFVASIWAAIGFAKDCARWVASNQSDDCPPVMFSRNSRDAEQMRIDYIQERILTEDFLSRVRAGVLCPRCLGLGREEDGDTACRTCGNTGCVPLADGSYGSYDDPQDNVVNWWGAREDAIANRDIVCFSDEAHAELANMLAKEDWRVTRGPDTKKRLSKGSLRPGGDCWNDVETALQTFQSNRWITAGDIAAAAGDGSYSNAQVTTVLGRMAEFNIVTTSGSRRSKKYCVTDQWLRDVR